MTFRMYCVLFILTVLTLNSVFARPKYLECTSTDECDSNSCCVLGTGRFSLPRCAIKGGKGSLCRPLQDNLVNRTLTYPDSLTINFTDIYLTICPCADNLICSKFTGTCENSIYDEGDDNFDIMDNYV